MKKLAWHFDLHTPGYVRVNTNPDVTVAAETLRDAGVAEIITFAKCHFGYAYYPTQVGTSHPRMRGDAFGDFRAACKKAGVKVLAYVSFGIDGQAAEQHPDWAQAHTPDGPVVHPGFFNSVCPFTPYTDELMFPQIAEIIEGYRPEGFFFDTMGAMGLCYCECCKKAFRDATGKEIPEEEDDPLHAEYGKFRHDRALALIGKVGDFIQERLPGAKVGFNQVGSIPYPEPLPEHITCLSLDPPTYGPQGAQFSMNASYGSTATVPSDVMPTIFNQGWGDWSLSPNALLRQVAATVWARGVRLYVGDRLHPQNRLDKRTVHALDVLSDLHDRMEAEMPPEGTPSVPDALLLHSPYTVHGTDMSLFARMPRDRLLTLQGAHRLQIDAGVSSAIVAECYLADSIEKPGLVVLPEVKAIDAASEQRLKNFVEKGGKLLVVGRVPEVDGKTMDWLGVRLEVEPWQDHIYLPPWEDEDEVLGRGDFHKLTLDGAEAVRHAIPAWDARHGHRYGWGIGPACDEPSDVPVLTRHTLGKGEVWYLGATLFSDYHAHGNWQQIGWWARLLDHMAVKRRVILDELTGNVELVVYADEDHSWAVLVNLNGEQTTGIGTRNWARTVGFVPNVDVTVRFPLDGRSAARVVSHGEEMEFLVERDTLNVPLVMDSEFEVVRVDWK